MAIVSNISLIVEAIKIKEKTRSAYLVCRNLPQNEIEGNG